jgi:hypothetical protein
MTTKPIGIEDFPAIDGTMSQRNFAFCSTINHPP